MTAPESGDKDELADLIQRIKHIGVKCGVLDPTIGEICHEVRNAFRPECGTPVGETPHNHIRDTTKMVVESHTPTPRTDALRGRDEMMRYVNEYPKLLKDSLDSHEQIERELAAMRKVILDNSARSDRWPVSATRTFDPNTDADAKRVIEWIDNPQRKQAQAAFTEGMERQIAYRFEDACSRSTSGSTPPEVAWWEFAVKDGMIRDGADGVSYIKACCVVSATGKLP